jgi:hypothetical protein
MRGPTHIVAVGSATMALATATLAAGTEAICRADVGMVASCRVEGKPPNSNRACISDLALAEQYRSEGMYIGLPYPKVLEVAQKMTSRSGLRFRIVFRPVGPQDQGNGTLLAMNPHGHSGVKVCRTHGIELYVGRVPFWTMPDVTLVGLAVDKAKALLAELPGIPEPDVQYVVSAGTEGSGKVVAQWPPRREAALQGVSLSRFDTKPQRPLLIVADGKEEIAAAPLGCLPGSHVDAAGEVEGENQSSTVVAAGVAGLGLGAAAVRLVRRGNPPAPRAPTTPARSVLALPSVRAWPDVDKPHSSEGSGRV